MGRMLSTRGLALLAVACLMAGVCIQTVQAADHVEKTKSETKPETKEKGKEAAKEKETLRLSDCFKDKDTGKGGKADDDNADKDKGYKTFKWYANVGDRATNKYGLHSKQTDVLKYDRIAHKDNLLKFGKTVGKTPKEVKCPQEDIRALASLAVLTRLRVDASAIVTSALKGLFHPKEEALCFFKLVGMKHPFFDLDVPHEQCIKYVPHYAPYEKEEDESYKYKSYTPDYNPSGPYSYHHPEYIPTYPKPDPTYYHSKPDPTYYHPKPTY